MEIVLKVCAIAVVGALSVTVLKRSLSEMAVAATVTTLIVIVLTSAGLIGTVIKLVYELAGRAGISSELLQPLIKCVGISIVTKLGCDVCRDGGVSSAATYIEFVGGAAAIVIAAPLMMTVLDMIT
ncbi:MAG: hypothetical protein IJE70_01415 [Oscillospiraceae bacterium]|nr:hypothetical protein [Oscillospiraceae bacterium]MBQ6901690.1 hypothetical protein [Oscillospiraceae bacterium]